MGQYKKKKKEVHFFSFQTLLTVLISGPRLRSRASFMYRIINNDAKWVPPTPRSSGVLLPFFTPLLFLPFH